MIHLKKAILFSLSLLLVILTPLSSAQSADFRNLNGKKLRSFESCVCRCSLGLAPHVGAELSLKKVRTYNPNASCAKLSSGPCIGGGMGCNRGYPKDSCIRKCMKEHGVENYTAAKAHFDEWNRKVRPSQVAVTAIRGAFKKSSDGGSTWLTVQPGQSVEVTVQDMIRTSNDTRAKLTFPDGSVFLIKSNTTLVLVSGGIKLRVGEAWFNLRKQGKRFQVVTPTTVCGVLGTAGIVTTSPEGITVIKLVEGQLEVSNQAGEGKIILKAGYLTVVPPCGVPSPPCRFDPSKLEEPIPQLAPAVTPTAAAPTSNTSSKAAQSSVSSALADDWYKKGLDAIRSAKWPQAVDLLSKALRSGSLDKKKAANAYYQRAWAQSKLGKPSDSLADVEKAIQLNPNSSLYHHMRAWWLMKHKRYQEALEECRVALRLNPKNLFAYHTLSRTREEMGSCQDALKYARKALSLRPNSQGLKNNLARLMKKGCGGPITIKATSDQNIAGNPKVDSDAIKDKNYHVVDRNQSRSELVLTFANTPAGKAKAVSLILHIPAVKDAESQTGFLVYQGKALLGKSGRIKGGSAISITLDPARIRLGGQVVLTIKGASDDGSYIKSVASGQGPVLKIVLRQAAGRTGDDAATSKNTPNNTSATAYEGVWTRSNGGKVVEVIKISRQGTGVRAAFQEGFNKPPYSTAAGSVSGGQLTMRARHSKTGKNILIKIKVQGNQLNYTSYNADGSKRWSGSYVRYNKTAPQSLGSSKPSTQPSGAAAGSSSIAGVCYVANQAASGKVLDLKLGMPKAQVEKNHQVLPYQTGSYRLWEDKNPCLANYSYSLAKKGFAKKQANYALVFEVDEKNPAKPLKSIQAKIVCGKGIELSKRLFAWYAKTYGEPAKKTNKMDGTMNLGSRVISAEFWHTWHLKGGGGLPPMSLKIKRRNDFEYYTITLKLR